MTKERIRELSKQLLDAKQESETRFTKFNIQPHELHEIMTLALFAFEARKEMTHPDWILHFDGLTKNN